MRSNAHLVPDWCPTAWHDPALPVIGWQPFRIVLMLGIADKRKPTSLEGHS